MKIVKYLFAGCTVLISAGFVHAHDPQGTYDNMYVLCGTQIYPGSGTVQLRFQIRFHSDNTGNNRIMAMACPVVITGNNISSVDTSQGKAFAGSVFEYSSFKTVSKRGNPDPSARPFKMYYMAGDPLGGSATGDSIFANVTINVVDTGTVCFDTQTFDLAYPPDFETIALHEYPPGWVSPSCCKVSPVSPFDLAVFVAGGPARPGFQKTYAVSYHNKGGNSSSATVSLQLPSDVNYISSTPPGSYNSSNKTLTWNVGLLAPGQGGILHAQVQITPGTPLGRELVAIARIEPTLGDINQGNNSYSEVQVVRGSFDPNEKLAMTPGAGQGGEVLITDTLRYQVNFQNVGTDTAFNIVIRDTLDAKLDPGTIELGAVSHQASFFLNGRELIWTFSNINLPDSNVNEPSSHGFVTYRVSSHPDAQLGSSIINRANIYFDYNPPVSTNTVNNVLCSMAGDANNNGSLSLTDIIATVNYIFNKSGCTPQPLCWLSNSLCRGDWDGSATVTLSDVIRGVNYIFNRPGGPWNPVPIGVCCMPS